MAYEKINWQNHIVEYPFRRKIEDNEDGTYTVKPDVGEVIQRGTKQSAENFNHMDDGIYDLDRRVSVIEESGSKPDLQEVDKDDVERIFEMAGSGVYPEDMQEASISDIDALFD